MLSVTSKSPKATDRGGCELPRSHLLKMTIFVVTDMDDDQVYVKAVFSSLDLAEKFQAHTAWTCIHECELDSGEPGKTLPLFTATPLP